MQDRKIIHAGALTGSKGKKRYLLLLQEEKHLYTWYFILPEKPTEVGGETPQRAINEARIHWKGEGFTPLRCGYRFTLPERDEIGANALFGQMMASYASPGGNYFDDDLGQMCIVKEASGEAIDLLRLLGRAQQV